MTNELRDNWSKLYKETDRFFDLDLLLTKEQIMNGYYTAVNRAIILGFILGIRKGKEIK